MPNLECGVEASAGLQLPWPPAIKPRQRKLLHVRLFPLSVHQPTDRLRRRDVHLDEQLKQPRHRRAADVMRERVDVQSRRRTNCARTMTKTSCCRRVLKTAMIAAA